MTQEDFLQHIGINIPGEYGDDAYIVDLSGSEEYGKVFTILDKSDNLTMLQDNQLVTSESSSLLYQSTTEPYILNLLGD